MAISPLPPHIEQLGRRRFSFYPPILGIEHNEWMYGSANWSEIQVINAHSGAEIWVPRRFLGEVSRVEDPILIVGLKRELEIRQGVVWPHQRHVIEMPVAELPVAVNERHSRSEAPRSHLAPVVNIRLEPSHDGRAARRLVVVLVLGVVACSIVIGVARNTRVRTHMDRSQASQIYLRLNRNDSYESVVRKIGPPSSERAESRGSLTYRILEYRDRHFTVILMGRTLAEARYAGAIDPQRRVLDSAPDGLGPLP